MRTFAAYTWRNALTRSSLDLQTGDRKALSTTIKGSSDLRVG